MVRIYDNETGELVFTYTEEMEPEIMDSGHYFTVFYLWDSTELAVCDYVRDKYYYEEAHGNEI